MRMNRRGYWGAILVFVLCFSHLAAAQDEMPKGDSAATMRTKPAPAVPPSPVEQDADIPPAGAMTDMPVAILQGLDKITARVRRIPIKVGQSAAFGTLSIQVDACRKAPPEDQPESAAFLKVTDAKPGVAPKVVFSGWMFASSPALSAMDHPVYDIGVIDCANETTASAPPAH
jgi:hypothetical protein